MFSTLIIRDCGLNAHQPAIVSLKATPSFPACARDYVIDHQVPVPDSWAAKDISTADGCLELCLLERIAEGRIGVTYSARVIAATTESGSGVTSTLPEVVCLKFAKKQHCRSLAREAWFYEQLAEVQGISIAHCYGYFSSTFSKQEQPLDSIVPWGEIECPYNPDDEPTSWTSPSVDWLPDDPANRDFHDKRGCKRDSLWNTWNFAEGDPTITVLVLEKLGERCEEHWEEGKEPREGLREDLAAVFEDIGEHGLVHCDVNVFNLLCFRGADTPERHCPRHNVVHGWRVIDFDRSVMVDMKNASEGGKDALRWAKRRIGSSAVFWGDRIH